MMRVPECGDSLLSFELYAVCGSPSPDLHGQVSLVVEVCVPADMVA